MEQENVTVIAFYRSGLSRSVCIYRASYAILLSSLQTKEELLKIRFVLAAVEVTGKKLTAHAVHNIMEI